MIMKLNFEDYETGCNFEWEINPKEFIKDYFLEKDLEDYVINELEHDDLLEFRKSEDKAQWLIDNSDFLYDHESIAREVYEDEAIQEMRDYDEHIRSLENEWFKSR